MRTPASRAQRLIVAVTSSLAAVTGGFLLGSLVDGYTVPVPALVVALLAGWLCVGALLVLPSRERARRTETRVEARATERGEHAEACGRERDPISGLPRYEPARDDHYVTATGDLPGSVVVVEIADHVTGSAIDPDLADRLVADAAARVAVIGSAYGAVARRLDGPRLLLLLPGLEESVLMALAGILHDAAAITRMSRAALCDPGQPVRLVAGVAVAGGESAEVATLVRGATCAAAQGKRRDSKTPVVFHDGLADEARERLAVGRPARDDRRTHHRPRLPATDRPA